MAETVIVLLIACKRDLEWVGHEVKKVGNALRRPAYPSLHSHRQVAFVVETGETPAELVERLRFVLEIDAFENYWAFVPGPDIAAKHSGTDPFASRVIQAYENVRKRNQAKYVRKTERREPVVERTVDDIMRSAPVEVDGRSRRKRKHPRDAYRP